jgi:arylsulfatase A-like enzyme
MERGLLELALLALVVVNACSFVRAHGAGPPNVVFIVVDDLGWDDVGFRNNGEIHTPNIDKLAMEGVVLDQYYVQDVCSPSRATFMTGRYPIHNSIVDWIPPASSYGLPLNETTMAQKFKEAGYMSHATGKWHLGFYKWEHTPTFRGFDSFKGFYSGGEDYFSHVANGAYDFRTDSRPDCGKGCSALNTGDQGRYSTTVFSEEAVRIVNSHKKTRPLFLYLAYQGVHSPVSKIRNKRYHDFSRPDKKFFSRASAASSPRRIH